MKRNAARVTAVTALIALSVSCGSNSAPLAPAPPAAIPATTVPNVAAMTAQAPIKDQVLSALTATLVATPATGDATLLLQYRFQVFNDAGTLVLDSGLVNAPTWTTTITLTPTKRYTWKARAEYQGFAGSWSDIASFTTPDPPPAFPGPIGDWQSCASLTNKGALVNCVHAAVRPTNSVGDFEVVKRVAWLLRGEGAGLLIKSGGENVVLWQGYSLSATRLCYRDGHIYKIISDAGPGGTNGPGFADNGFVDLALHVPAIDPSKP